MSQNHRLQCRIDAPESLDEQHRGCHLEIILCQHPVKLKVIFQLKVQVLILLCDICDQHGAFYHSCDKRPHGRPTYAHSRRSEIPEYEYIINAAIYKKCKDGELERDPDGLGAS